MVLPTNIDSVYADDGGDASVKEHQQHHDEIHAAVNALPTTYAPLANGKELSYVEFTSSVNITATVEASADTVVTAAAVSLDGSTSVEIEFFSCAVRPTGSTSATLSVWLFDGSTSLGQIALASSQAANSGLRPVLAKRRLVNPSAASHTYSVRATVSSGTGNVGAGAGAAGNSVPGYIQVSTVPHT